jgi:hypothetical protein
MPFDPEHPPLIVADPPQPKKRRISPSTSTSPGSKERFQSTIEEVEFSPAWDEKRDGPDYQPLLDTDFTFTPETTSMTTHTTIFKPYYVVSQFIARDRQNKPKQIIVHANNKVTLKDHATGADLSETRMIHRAWRHWRAKLDPANIDQLVAGTGYEDDRKEYELDGISAPMDGGWYDVPGFRLKRRKDVTGLYARFVIEFLVGISRHPEFGAYAFIVVLDVTPTKFRVRQSEAVKLTEQEWKDRTRDPATIATLRTHSGPSPDPDGAAVTWPINSGWVDYTSELNLLPP